MRRSNQAQGQLGHAWEREGDEEGRGMKSGSKKREWVGEGEIERGREKRGRGREERE